MQLIIRGVVSQQDTGNSDLAFQEEYNSISLKEPVFHEDDVQMAHLWFGSLLVSLSRCSKMWNWIVNHFEAANKRSDEAEGLAEINTLYK